MRRILLLQGANMNALGVRDPHLYGTTTAAELDEMLRKYAVSRDLGIDIRYTNDEGQFIDWVYAAEGEGFEAIVTNTGSFCYNSYAIRDAFSTVKLPVIEVHMSNQLARDIHSVTGAGANGMVMGMGHASYFTGLDAAIHMLTKRDRP